MTEARLRQKVVRIARGHLGDSEQNGRYRKIIWTYNAHRPLAQGYEVQLDDEWCATGVSTVFIEAELTDIGFTECSCPRMIQMYKKAGRWMERDDYVPAPGDLVMYHWKDTVGYAATDCIGNPNHVGIVEKVQGGYIHVIEFNKDGKVDYRYLKVNGRYIRGFCLPDYKSKSVEEDEDMDQATFDKMLENYLARKAKEGASAWAVNAVSQAKTEGIMDGTRPQSFASRQEVAQMILNAKK